jgi:hypothetical protein
MVLTEEYYPPESIYYDYNIKKSLLKNVELLSDCNEYKSIILCVYKINKNGKFPFLEYLLNYFHDNNTLSLLTLPVFTSFNKSNLISYSKVYLSAMINVINFEEFSENIEFDGFHEFESNLYLFFDVSNCKYNLDETYLSSNIRFAIIDEILNHKNVCNIEINKDTVNYFLMNESLNFLHDKNGEAYENPIVGFVGKPTQEKTNFTYIFGENSNDKSGILGPFYYFTNFQNAIRQGGWSKNYEDEIIFNKKITDESGKYIKGGIVRFALFLGRTKYIENMPNDPIDESEIKKYMLEDPTMDKKYVIQTLRISDHDGIWSNDFDSAYLGNIELDDGNLLKDFPILAIKEYDQQIPLSSHFIDKKKLGDRFDVDNLNYSIV